MQADEIRKKFLEFFEKKGHKILPSASLVPENDPTVLFTTAGMHPLVPYFLGEKHPLGRRLVNSQKCLRTDDIDEVGDSTHLTFFEMLGNWSLGAYFKKEAIEMSFQFLTKELNIPLGKLAVSVFEGEAENNIPRDEESSEIWQELGIRKERLAYLGREDNWWGPAGQTGPCGPDTEMFYWTGKSPAPEKFDPNDEKWVEIWNDVFMEFDKQADGSFKLLKQKNVDTGMGLERVAAVLQGKDNVFETKLFEPIIKQIKNQKSKIKDENQNSKIQKEKAERIIADHLKAAVFILAEKIAPSNLERGYILRRLIRRAVRYGKFLSIENNFTASLAEEVIKIYQDVYSEVKQNEQFILKELEKEEENFQKTLERGLKEFEKINASGAGFVSGTAASTMYQTYGFPIEMIRELAREKGMKVDEQGFEQGMKKHQELSRTAAQGKFKAGLADQSDKTIKYHTATHLLLAALRFVLGSEIQQRGSNINPERLRFDFAFARKLTEDELKEVEDWINDKIEQGLAIKVEEMTVREAQKAGALANFRERYPDRVKVYTIFEPKSKDVFSKEICSGPHCQNLRELSRLGRFKIVKEQSSSGGVRRIRAVLQ